MGTFWLRAAKKAHALCVWALVLAICPYARADTTEPSRARMQRAWQDHQTATAHNQPSASDKALATLVQEMDLSGWPGAWAYGESLAEQADALPTSPKALVLAQTALHLAPHRPAPLWATARQLWGDGQLLASIATLLAALGSGAPPGHPFLAWLLRPGLWAVVSAVWAIGLYVVLQLGRIGPQMVHDLSHALPKAVRPGVSYALAALGALALWACPLGPLPWAALLLVAMAPYQPGPLRQGSAMACALGACALWLAPHLLAPVQQPATAAGARYYALQDATAQWAQDRLPQADQAHGLDLWALALIARFEGDTATSNTLGRQAVAQGVLAPELFTLLGNMQWEQKDFEGARVTYGLALNHAPHDSIARFNLSQALLSLARPNEAEKARTQAFNDGGPAMVAQAAQAQKWGRLLVEPMLSPRLIGRSQADSADGLLVGAQKAAMMLLTGRVPPRAAVALVVAVSWSLIALAVLGQISPHIAAYSAPRMLTRRCTRCHTLSCPRCSPEAAEAGLCAHCRQAAMGADEAGIALRPVQERKSMQHYHTSLWLRRLGGLVWPGLGLLARGRIALGLMLSTATGLVVAQALTRAHLLPDAMPLWAQPVQGLGHTVGLGLDISLLVGLWAISIIASQFDPT